MRLSAVDSGLLLLVKHSWRNWRQYSTQQDIGPASALARHDAPTECFYNRLPAGPTQAACPRTLTVHADNAIILYYVILNYIILCYVMLCYVILCYIKLPSKTPHNTTASIAHAPHWGCPPTEADQQMLHPAATLSQSCLQAGIHTMPQRCWCHHPVCCPFDVALLLYVCQPNEPETESSQQMLHVSGTCRLASSASSPDTPHHATT
jgi:hypothetical protein